MFPILNKLCLESAAGHNACASTMAQEGTLGATATQLPPKEEKRGLAIPLPQAVVAPL